MASRADTKTGLVKYEQQVPMIMDNQASISLQQTSLICRKIEINRLHTIDAHQMPRLTYR